MTISEFETDDLFDELNRKFANVSLERSSPEELYKEITHGDLLESRDVLRFSNDQSACYYAMKNFRRYLTQEISEERIQSVLDLDILDIVIQCLGSLKYEDMQYEAAWVVTNLAYGTIDQTLYLIHNGVVDSLHQCFLTAKACKIKAQSAWAIANISVDSAGYREDMAKLDIIGDIARALLEKCEPVCSNQHIIEGTNTIYDNKRDNDDIKDLAWSLSNLCRGGFKTLEFWEQYLLAFNAFTRCLFFDNNKVWSEAGWGLSRVLSNMFDNEWFYSYLEINPKVYTRLVQLIRDQPSSSILPILQTISNFTSAPNNYIENLLSADLLLHLHQYTQPDMHPQLRRNAFLTISNLAAGGEDIVTKVIYNQDIMSSVILTIKIPLHEYSDDTKTWTKVAKLSPLKQSEEWKILKEVLWVISNIFALASEEGICFTLRTYTTIVSSLARLLRFPRLTLPVCLKLVDVFTNIVERTSKVTEMASAIQAIEQNPYIQEMLGEDLLRCLSEQCSRLESDELQRQSEALYCTITSAEIARNASAFGLPVHIPSVRRIVHGFEDGDIRLIENAFTNIQL